MNGLAISLALAAALQTIVESETFGVDWPSLDGWDCRRDQGRDRIKMTETGKLQLVRTLNGGPPALLFDCAAHELGGSKTSRWERGGICEVAWSVEFKVDGENATKGTLDVIIDEDKLAGYQCAKITPGERA